MIIFVTVLNGPKVRSPTGNDLPDARNVSKVAISVEGEELGDPDQTLLVMTWGQFLDHDLGLAPECKLEISLKYIFEQSLDFKNFP